MTPPSTEAGESAIKLMPPAAAITSDSLPAIEVMSSTFSEFADQKELLGIQPN